MDKTISTVILSDEIQTKEILKLYLNEFGVYESVEDCSDFSEIYNHISSSAKSFLIVDISSENPAYLDFITKVSTDCPNCKILVISDRPTVDLIVKVMRAGAREFLPVPLIKNDFFVILNKVSEQLNGAFQKTDKCKVLTVFSNKGGIGKTSIAVNLALELAKITKENVALIDLNFQLGDITTFMDLKPSFNISYMLQNLDKINKDFLLSTLEKYKNTSLYILADPPYFKQAENISTKPISKLFDILKETFSYIVVDTDTNLDGKTISALDHSDMVFLILTANLPALRNCQRCLDIFQKLGYDKEKTKIIINRYMENDEIKEEDIEKVLENKVYWKIPNNYFTMMSSINKGVPVSEINATSNVAKSYKELALLVSDNIYKQSIMKRFADNTMNDFDNILRG